MMSFLMKASLSTLLPRESYPRSEGRGSRLSSLQLLVQSCRADAGLSAEGGMPTGIRKVAMNVLWGPPASVRR